jgi:hypothetical protein
MQRPEVRRSGSAGSFESMFEDENEDEDEDEGGRCQDAPEEDQA